MVLLTSEDSVPSSHHHHHQTSCVLRHRNVLGLLQFSRVEASHCSFVTTTHFNHCFHLYQETACSPPAPSGCRRWNGGTCIWRYHRTRVWAFCVSAPEVCHCTRTSAISWLQIVYSDRHPTFCGIGTFWCIRTGRSY